MHSFDVGSLAVEGDRGNYRGRGGQRCASEANAQLMVSEAKMQKTIDYSSEVVTLLRRELNEEIENYELLKNGNDSLLEERNNVRFRVADLESEVAKVRARVAEDIFALEARLAAAEVRAMEDSTAAEK
jgi:phosphoribosylaminoimidazole carboxylase (NCAIR synthetase)